MAALCAIVLTLNEEKHLPACLASLAWADDVLVFDSFSTDRTLDIAHAHGARVIQRRFDNYAAQRQAALQATTAEWVLFVDADERVPPALAAEIRAALAGPENGWWLPRHNYLFGVLTLHAGWYPDEQLRLMRRALAHYDPTRPVHELVHLPDPIGHLREPLVHLNYETVGEFVTKQRHYAAYAAQQRRAEGWRARPHHYITLPVRQFVWRFFTLGGWRAGWHGLRLSALMAWFEWETCRQLAALEKP